MNKQDSFDVTVCNDTLEHIYDPRRAVLEMERVVKLGGYVCINLGPLWLSPFGSHFSEFYSPPWGHLFFSEKSVKNVLIKFGRFRESEFQRFKELNRITLREFNEILHNTQLKKLFLTLYAVPPFEPFLKTPLREFFTIQIIALLRK